MNTFRHTPISRWFRLHAVAVSLVCLTGCAQFAGQTSESGSFPAATTPVTQPPTSGPTSGPTSATQTAAGQLATSSADGATTKVAQAVGTGNESGAVTTAGAQQPYVAHQFPNNPGVTTPPSYQAPPPQGYQAPPPGYQAPPPGYQPPPGSQTPPGYQAPPPQYIPPPVGAPGSSFGGPPPGPTLPPGPDYRDPTAPSLDATGQVDPNAPVLPTYPYTGPPVREADLVITGFPARTGRIMVGGAVNSDAGVTGQITVDERNFDITRWPKSFQDFASGTAFRGAGQTFRLEAAPGSDFQRYTLQFAEPNLFGYKPVSMSLSGFLYDRRFNDWDEQRLGGRVAFGYQITPDLSVTAGITGQNVKITRPRIQGIPELDAVLGNNEFWTFESTLRHDTRNSPIQPSQGHFFQLQFEQAFGDFSYPRLELEHRKYWLLAERADGSGKQTISYALQLGFSGNDTPIFENFFAGGYATLRGFDFRGASPTINGVEVGGEFQWLNSLEYMFPITADDAFRGVAFVDFGTVEPEVQLRSDSYRVAPGVGLRVAIPMLGPAPLAFDFAYPVAKADTDRTRVFSFYMSVIR